MKNRTIIDFETYYDKTTNVVTQGLPNYVRDADAYIVSVVNDEFEFCGTLPELAASFNLDELARSAQPVAANSNFDQAFWEKYFPAFRLPWHCVLDHAASHQYPRDVAGVSRTLLHEKMDKSQRDEMKGIRYETLSDERKQKNIDYCLNDSIKEKQMLEALPPMTEIERRIAEHTRLINRRGVHIDTDKVERDKSFLERIHHDAFQQIPWTDREEGVGRPPLSAEAFDALVRGRGVEPPESLDKRESETNAWLALNPQFAPIVQSMRDYRGSNTLLKKLIALENLLTDDNRLPMEILYCGARHTRRWSSKGFNVQNLTKEPMFNSIMRRWPEFAHLEEHALDDVGIFMREYLVPPPGYKFGLLDLAQIEPRCLNWLIGNEALLSKIRAGFSIYEAFALEFEGWRGAPGTIKTDLGKTKYTMLKNRVIGLGYGMGVGRFVEYNLQNGGVIITPEEARDTVHGFRRNNPLIPAFWRMFDRHVEDACNSKTRELAIEMPTGDFLRHFRVRKKLVKEEHTDLETGKVTTRIKTAQESYTIRGDFSQQSHQPRCWGGTLAENVTQRMARDVLAEAVLRLEAAGFPVVFHSHDEVITLLPAATAERDLIEAGRYMLVPPDWCPDLPLGFEGSVAEHYDK